MDDEQIKQQIAGLSILSKCGKASGAVIELFMEIGETVDVPDETLLLREGDVRGTQGFVLTDGAVQVIKSERVPVKLEAPALIGEMQQFSVSGSRSASVMADGPCRVLRFDWLVFYQALEGKLRPFDLQMVRDAIRRYSWGNMMDSEDE